MKGGTEEWSKGGRGGKREQSKEADYLDGWLRMFLNGKSMVVPSEVGQLYRNASSIPPATSGDGNQPNECYLYTTH